MFVGIAADNEDISLLKIDNLVDEMKAAAYEKFSEQLQDVKSLRPAAGENADNFAVRSGLKIGYILGFYYGFNIRLEEVRQHAYKKLREYYRTQLSSIKFDAPEQFFNSVRERPSILDTTFVLLNTLKTGRTNDAWMEQSVDVFKTFFATQPSFVTNSVR